MKPPETNFAWNGEVALAYQVFGAGPTDLVYLQGYLSHVLLNWQSPHLARFLRGLGERARVIHTDRRGWGCSDRFSPGDVAPLEVQVDDLVTVMDAAGSERAIIFGSFDTALTAMLFAATYPERTAGLVLVDPFVTYVQTDETPWMRSEAEWEEHIAVLRRGAWGRPEWEAFSDEREETDWFLPWCVASVSPGSLIAEVRAFYRVDVRGVLPSIQAPTLVVGSGGRPIDRGGLSLDAPFIADRIAGSRLIEPADEGIAWFHWYGRASSILAAVSKLVAGIREEQASFDRVLATVLFTDIVNSTATTARLGDADWGKLVRRHHATVRGLLARYRGVEVDTAGDGFFATFDGPARAVTCARAIVSAMKPLGIEVRAGLHTGEVETIAGKAGGIAVVIGARVGAMAGSSEVLVSRTVKDLTAGSGLLFEDAGEHELKGVPEPWRLYRLNAPAP